MYFSGTWAFSSLLFAVILTSAAAARAPECDESLEKEVVALFENCFGSYKQELEALAERKEIALKDESCRLVYRYMQCSSILSICHSDDKRNSTDDMMRRSLLSMFNGEQRQRDVNRCLMLFAGNGRPKRSPGVKEKLKKLGKYIAVGVAAFGAYKLVKKMTKGSKKAYEDDDCWEYDRAQDRYKCVCSSKCDVYASASIALASTLGLGSLLCFSTLVALISKREF